MSASQTIMELIESNLSDKFQTAGKNKKKMDELNEKVRAMENIISEQQSNMSLLVGEITMIRHQLQTSSIAHIYLATKINKLMTHLGCNSNEETECNTMNNLHMHNFQEPHQQNNDTGFVMEDSFSMNYREDLATEFSGNIMSDDLNLSMPTKTEPMDMMSIISTPKPIDLRNIKKKRKHTACTSCHISKTECKFAENKYKSCERCIKIGKKCTKRISKRKGRPLKRKLDSTTKNVSNKKHKSNNYVSPMITKTKHMSK